MTARIRQWGLILILAWAPLPFGSARMWAWDLLGIAAMLLLLLSAAQDFVEPRRAGAVSPLKPAAILGGIVVVWILFQGLPLDLAWRHPIWDRAAEALDRPLASSISLDREQSMVHLFRLLTYAAYFLLGWMAARRAEGADAILRAVAVAGAAYSVYGLVEFVSPEPHILWFLKDAYVTDVTSTFVNRNSFATFVGLAVIANLALIAKALIRKMDVRSRRSLILSMIGAMLGAGRWWAMGLVLTSGALLMSHSRAGLVATLIAIVALTVLLLAAPSARAPWRFWFGGFVGLGVVAILLLAGSATFERLGTVAADGEMRPLINAALLRAIGDNALTGTGLGSFPHIFTLYQPPSIAGYVDMAHNDYLENMLELGIPAALLLFAAVLYLGIRCALGVFRRRRDAIYPCAGAAATVLIGVHSAFDFSMQIPAVAVTYAVILGIGVAQSVNSRDAG